MPSKTVTLAVLCASLLVLAGCLSGGPAVDGSDADDVETGPETRTQNLHERAQNQPEPVAVYLDNEWNRTVEMEVAVLRESTNETVYRERHEVPPGTHPKPVYSTERVTTDIESFTVVVTARNTTERVSVRTNACHGDVFGAVAGSGDLTAGHEIC